MYGGIIRGTMKSVVKALRRGRSVLAKRMPTGTPKIQVEAVVARAKRKLWARSLHS
jgi:hypothetical protein